MTPTEAIDLAERALRRGSCSAHKLAAEGCATCEASEEAIRVLRTLPVLRTCGGCVEHVPRCNSISGDYGWCGHDDAPGTETYEAKCEDDAAPPSWCPLRGKS